MSADSVAQRIRDLWDADLAGPVGVLHVAAIGRDPCGRNRVLRIGPDTPQSEADSFALAVARARADAIVTTGGILRAEPDVSHDPGPELLAWRRDVRGKHSLPAVVVLTRGTGLPLEHPVFQRSHVLVATSPEAARDLRGDLSSRSVEVIGLRDLSPRGLVEALVRRGFHDVCMEAGPSTTAVLYEPPRAVDELLLSVYEQASLSGDGIAGDFASDAALEDVFGPPTSDAVRTEASGRWRFRRYVRPTVGRAG